VVATDGALTAIDLPADLQPDVAYGVAVVDGAENPEGAQSFIDGCLWRWGGGRLVKPPRVDPQGLRGLLFFAVPRTGLPDAADRRHFRRHLAAELVRSLADALRSGPVVTSLAALAIIVIGGLPSYLLATEFAAAQS
jgi:hypothetical protein